MYYRVLARDEHFQTTGPKRILALDGGGLRGILTLGFLRQIENILRARHGEDPNFRLCRYFDLIAGTSTGAIIAAALVTGMSPFNNPSLQAFLYATLDGYNVKWKTGPEQMLLVSVGTGASDPSRTPSGSPPRAPSVLCSASWTIARRWSRP